jgi:hypothetical protein
MPWPDMFLKKKKSTESYRLRHTAAVSINGGPLRAGMAGQLRAPAGPDDRAEGQQRDGAMMKMKKIDIPGLKGATA